LSHKHLVFGYYCDNDRCDFDEYCCGHNICCTSYNVWQMWYFWLGLVIFLILLAGCFSFWRYRYQQSLVVQSCNHTGYAPFVQSASTQNIPAHLVSIPGDIAGENYINNTEHSYRPATDAFSGKNGMRDPSGAYT